MEKKLYHRSEAWIPILYPATNVLLKLIKAFTYRVKTSKYGHIAKSKNIAIKPVVFFFICL